VFFGCEQNGGCFTLTPHIEKKGRSYTRRARSLPGKKEQDSKPAHTQKMKKLERGNPRPKKKNNRGGL
jgi:hypothetical protein